MTDTTSLTPPSPGLSATLFPNKSVELYSPKGPVNNNNEKQTNNSVSSLHFRRNSFRLFMHRSTTIFPNALSFIQFISYIFLGLSFYKSNPDLDSINMNLSFKYWSIEYVNIYNNNIAHLLNIFLFFSVMLQLIHNDINNFCSTAPYS